MNNKEKKLREILFDMGKDIKIHKLVDGNMIIDIDYEKYIIEILNLFKE